MRDAEDNELHVPEHFAKVVLLIQIRVRLSGAILLSDHCHACALLPVITAQCQVMAEQFVSHCIAQAAYKQDSEVGPKICSRYGANGFIANFWCLYQFMRYSGKSRRASAVAFWLVGACCQTMPPRLKHIA